MKCLTDSRNEGNPCVIPTKRLENPHFRGYLHKSEAVLDVLRNTPSPLTLQLVEDLKEGHLSTDARAVNASLLNMNGVEKLPDGSYQIEGSSSIVNHGRPALLTTNGVASPQA